MKLYNKRWNHDEEKLLEKVDKVSNHLGTIFESLMTGEGGTEEEKMKSFLKKEVDKSLKPTNDAILNISESLDGLMGKTK